LGDWFDVREFRVVCASPWIYGIVSARVLFLLSSGLWGFVLFYGGWVHWVKVFIPYDSLNERPERLAMSATGHSHDRKEHVFMSGEV
jgi:hypothetical protein